MDRRGFLGTGVLGVAGLLAGCSFTNVDEGPKYPRLGTIFIINDRNTAQEVELRVRRGDEVIHQERYEVPASDPAESGPGRVEVEPSWPDEHAEYFVDARIGDGESWRSIDLLAAEVGGDCMSVQLRLRDGDEIRWFTNNTCPSSDGG
ncbi:twin-arginine translocation signal domain-containing protein [Halobacteriales archaeon Cl-PHB]